MEPLQVETTLIQTCVNPVRLNNFITQSVF